ncbi:hypothetical protein I634_14340 [Alteromonas mediterranea U8]|nr:hypothetical protein I634_14340 [Alteromonas mediterranea U8]
MNVKSRRLIYTEETDSELLLQLGNAQLTVPTNFNPRWVATVMCPSVIPPTFSKLPW